ncbi:MAG TPA: hypothetical protein VGI10_01495 [Polyangiaceae bacterium]
MTRPLRSVLPVCAFGLLVALPTCERRTAGNGLPPDGGAPPGNDARRPASDLPSDATLVNGSGPDAGTLDGGLSNSPSLRAFHCIKQYNPGKGTQGPLTIRFRPQGPADVVFHIEFTCTGNCRDSPKLCQYSADLRIDHGRLNDGVLGASMDSRCRSSTITGFALDCGAFLGSDVDVLVKAQAVTRTVNFRVPFTFKRGIPDRAPGDDRVACLPFVTSQQDGDGKEMQFIDNRQLVFPLENCALDP